MHRLATFTTAVLLLAPTVSAQGSDPAVGGVTATFQGLGDLPGGSLFESAGHAVSGDGLVVGGRSWGEGHEPFLWEDSVMISLGDLPGGGSQGDVSGISADGSVVVGQSESENGFEAFRWEDGTMTGLGYLPGGTASFAQGVSGDGSIVVGGGQSSNGSEAFRWENGTMTALGDLAGGSFSSAARDVSANGFVVVGSASSANGSEAFLWENGTMIGLGDLPGGSFHSHARSVSADGATVVGFSISANGLEAFRWQDGTMQGLGDVPGGTFRSFARGVSGDGSVVVGYSDVDGGFEAFIWTAEDGMRNLKEVLETDFGLDLTGWTLEDAYDVSTDGTVIVGAGLNPDGNKEGWRVDLAPPAPAPANDDIADAIILTESGTYEGTNVNATLEDEEPEPSCTFLDWTTNFSVWWSFVATGNGVVTMDTNGSVTPDSTGLDTILSLHNASGLLEVACNDDNGGGGLWSRLEDVPVNEGETYLIRVAGYNESTVNQGAIQLTTDFQFGIAGEGTPEEIEEGLSFPRPNPVREVSTFIVAVNETQDVTVEVFDVTGRRVQVLYQGELAGGTSESLVLDASEWPAGVYVVRATGDDFATARRVTVVR